MLKKILGIVFLVSGFWGLVSSASAQTESITFTTYYPSPYGVYKNLRIYPSSGTGLGGTCSNEGEMYYDQTARSLFICSGTPSTSTLTWTAVGGAAGSSWWTQAGNNLYPNEGDWNVGIGTDSPLLKLDVRGTNTKTTNAALENIIQAASADTVNPLTLRLGIKTDNTPSNRYAALEVDDAGTKRNLALQPSGGNVGIGTTTLSAGLKLDVEGAVGATQYCDQNGANCRTNVQQVLTGAACGSNEAIRVINPNGTFSCVDLPPSAICTWSGVEYSTGAQCMSGIRYFECTASGAWDERGFCAACPRTDCGE
jgi:hypothetical protein